jgi:NADH-quinone oxidoreductase subunit A
LKLSWLALVDVLVFFGVLLVGFAYVWKRGDLDWIRALTKKSKQAGDQTVSMVRT